MGQYNVMRDYGFGNEWCGPEPIFYDSIASLHDDMEYFYVDKGGIKQTANQIATTMFYGAISNEGQVIFSQFQHDFKYSNDRTTFCDGGHNWFRSNRTNMCLVFIRKGEIIISDQSVMSNWFEIEWPDYISIFDATDLHPIECVGDISSFKTMHQYIYNILGPDVISDSTSDWMLIDNKYANVNSNNMRLFFKTVYAYEKVLLG